MNLKENLERSRACFVRNLEVCLGQAKESQRINALEAAKHRKSKRELADWHFEGFDEASAVMAWVDEIKQVALRCPTVRDEKAKDTNGDASGLNGSSAHVTETQETVMANA